MPKKNRNPSKAAAARNGPVATGVPNAAPPSKGAGKRKGGLAGLVAAIGRRPKRAGKSKPKSTPKATRGDALASPLAEADLPSRPVAGPPGPRRLKGASKRKGAARPVRLGRLERLEFAIDEVRLGLRVSARTRKLQLSGVPKMAQKVIEEAGEFAIEAVQGNRIGLVNEGVDLLYNMLVLLSASGVTLESLWAEMDRRETSLGMAEKLPKAVDPET